MPCRYSTFGEGLSQAKSLLANDWLLGLTLHRTRSPLLVLVEDRAVAPLDYLVIAPHPDDAELGVGGTMLLLKAQGASVGVLDLTDGEPTPHGSPEIRRRETEAATALLGLDWRGNLGLPNRSLQADLDSRR